MATYVASLAWRILKKRQEDHLLDPNAPDILGQLPSDPVGLTKALADDAKQQDEGAQLTGYTPSVWLVERELVEVDARREALHLDAVDTKGSDPLRRAFRSNLIGLACSGGGIRSASFNLGLLQGFARLGLLRHVDYLSSVSGGGYIHQWLAAWLRRSSPGAPGATASTAEQAFEDVEKRLKPSPDGEDGKEAPEIRWLRRYSNYLTPRQGFFTADTWVGAATWIRNTLLNQITLIAGLFLLLLIPHLLAPPAGVPVNSAPPMPAESDVIIGVVAVILLLLLGLVTLFGSENLLDKDAKPADKDAKPAATWLLDDAGVQVFLVLPLIAWALLVTLLQEVIGPFASPTLMLVVSGVAGLALMGGALAFRGGALAAFAKNSGGMSTPWKRRFAIVGIALAVFFAAILGTIWILVVPPLVAELLASFVAVDVSRLRVLVGPPLVLLGPMLAVVVLVGLLGRTYQDLRREWLSRLTAWGGMYAALWMVYVGIAYAAQPSVEWLASNAAAGIPTLATWVGMTTAGVLAGKSAQTAASPGTTPARGRVPKELLATVAPYVFVLGLLFLVGWGAERAFVAVGDFGLAGFALLFLLVLGICFLFGWRVDVNDFSMHAFYRNRLARCYLSASNPNWKPNPFIAIDPQDLKVPLSDLRATTTRYPGPYPIFCTALNLSSGSELGWQERKAASFLFTPLYSGYDVPWTKRAAALGRLRPNGFVQTERYAYREPGIHIGTVAAISGAAASPNSGYHTNPVTAFLMTIFNVRLGWWLLNPRAVDEDGTKPGSTDDGRFWPTPRFAVSELVKELLGSVDDTRRYVYLSDGGHFDNMGLYELVRRRCRFIIVSDAEEDGEMKFGGIAMAIRKCRADFGVEISLDLRTLDRRESTGLSDRHVVIGSIKYPGIEEKGRLVYLKSSLTGDEPADLLGYHRTNDAFPHQSTADQWFSESQFESYRRLGLHITETTFRPVVGKRDRFDVKEDRRQLFQSLFDIWHPPTPEMQRSQAIHTNRYHALLSQIRTEPRLDGLLEKLYEPGDGDWTTGRAPANVVYAVGFMSELLEFMSTVYTDLNLVLPANAEHPHSQGWINLFAKCGKVDVVKLGWAKFGPSYPAAFQRFAFERAGFQRLPPAPSAP